MRPSSNAAMRQMADAALIRQWSVAVCPAAKQVYGPSQKTRNNILALASDRAFVGPSIAKSLNSVATVARKCCFNKFQ